MSIKKSFEEKLHKTTVFRRVVQFTAFVVINYAIIEMIFTINLLSFEEFLKVQPVQNSPRNPLSKGTGFVEIMFYFIAEGEFPLLLLGIFILLILFTNRFFCGWVCPIGTIQDCLAAVPTGRSKKKVSKDTHQFLLKLKYAIVVILLIVVAPLGITRTTDKEFYKDYRDNLGPVGEKPVSFFSLSEYIFVFFPNMITELYENWEEKFLEPLFTDFWIAFMFFFYLIVIICAVYYPRTYCRYLCPFGAISGAVNEYSFLKLSRSPVKCVGRADCGICERVCPMQIRILDEPFEFFTGGGECIYCLKCKESCPYKAINIKFG